MYTLFMNLITAFHFFSASFSLPILPEEHILPVHDQHPDQIDLSKLTGKIIHFELEWEDQRYGISFALLENDRIKVNCLLGGSASAVITGVYEAFYTDTGGKWLQINGTAVITAVSETEEISEREIKNGSITIEFRNGQYFGSIDLSPCECFEKVRLYIEN